MYHSSIDHTNILMTQRISYSGSNAEYIGFAPAGTSDGSPNWLIQKLSYDSSSNMIDRKFAGGTASFDKMWTKRTEYTYA